MLVYKADVMKELKDNGYTTYTLLKGNLLSSQTMNDIKNGKMVGIKAIGILCNLLKCQPGHLIKWVDENATNDDSEEE